MYMLVLIDESSRMRSVYKAEGLSLVDLTTDLYQVFSYGTYGKDWPEISQSNILGQIK